MNLKRIAASGLIIFNLLSCDKSDQIIYVTQSDVSEITTNSATVKVTGTPVNSDSPYTAGFHFRGVKDGLSVGSGDKNGTHQNGFYEVQLEGLVSSAVYTVVPYITIEGRRVYSEREFQFTTEAQIDIIGDIGPGGGIIFYDDGSGGGMEVYPTDWTAEWGGYSESVMFCETNFGEGQENTDQIIAQTTDVGNAARLCDSCTIGGMTDWFLPSKDELQLIYTALVQTGLVQAEYENYWSSSNNGSSQSSSYAMHLGLGVWTQHLRYHSFYVWPVRVF